MHKPLLAVVLLAAPVLAQSNAVTGLDIGMWELTDISFTGRRGAAFPNGEAGFMVGHSWCNGGAVNLPWVSEINGVMVDNYPRIAFLLVRESGGRMVQVSGQSFCKHSPIAFNFSNGPCAPCNAGSGQFFYVGCSDTYGSGTNASQYALGPTTEIDPWLGTWNPQGSYFDRGDPAVSGAAAIDSVRSLTFTQVQAFDTVKNRMVVRENELLSGATYYGQVQGVIQGEPVANRDNNLMNRQISITGSGGSWSPTASGSPQWGSVLTRWQGATFDMAGNGNDDGRFGVAVKVTGPTNGMWHYEYAVHNIDNNRGGATFRIPLAPGAIVQNAGFRDIDDNPLNDWTYTQTANELVFSAAAGNRLEWNTLYNCWFDCSIQPGAGSMTIDQALVGPGALDVAVPSHVPSGLAFAAKEVLGAACGQCTGTLYELFANSTMFDLMGRSMTWSLNSGAYTVDGITPVAFVPPAGTNLGLGLNGLTNVTLPFALPYPGGSTTQLSVSASGYVSPGIPNPAQGSPSIYMLMNGQPRWAAAWALYYPNATGANVYYDANPTRAVLTWSGVPFVGSAVPNTFQIQFFPNGTVNVVWQNIAASSFPLMVGWSPGGGHSDPGITNLSTALSTPRNLCAAPFDGLVLDTSAEPVIGTVLQWQVNGILPSTGWGVLLRSLTQATPAIDLTAIGMPGCYSHVIAPVTTLFVAPGTTQTVAESIPNVTAFVGVDLIGQAVTYNPTLNSLGLVASNGVKLSVGL
ncbi:MAG: hypothetical protein H6838_14465 [Planctomycetes bacterium]|nr:hypothetical protein [Planctomycetota bacterium]MCB9886694.1 hypothetical protein [Planctomycetota bacterium]